MAWLSILGLYQYDQSVFDKIVLPDNVDKELVISNILYDNAELGLLYMDLDIIKDMIGIWSRSEIDIWDRLNKAFNEEYNPIWNVDENTSETRTINRKDKTSSVDSGTTLSEVTGYNSNNLEVDNKGTINNSGSSDLNSDVTDNFTRRRGGNIGVTMSQQLLEAELETRPKLNIYKYISNSFKEKFCLMIY